MESLARELEEGSTGLLDPSLFTGPRRAGAWRRAPTRPLPFDVIEQADRVLLMFDLPGIARNDVKARSCGCGGGGGGGICCPPAGAIFPFVAGWARARC